MRTEFTRVIIVLILITCLFIGIGTYFYYDNKKFKPYAECGMEDGPIYGRKTNIDIGSIIVDESFKVPGGKLFVCNTTASDLELDSIAPIFFKLDSNDQVVWAVELISNKDIKLFAIEDCRLNGHEIHFFNSTHLEPGVIYLDENYDFKYMCLSMF
ncbi:MAG: hypothetical protein ACOVP1_14135 [Bacteroidia bacterium]